MFEIKSLSVSIGAALHLFKRSKLSFNFSLSILSFFDSEKMFSLARIGKFLIEALSYYLINFVTLFVELKILQDHLKKYLMVQMTSKP